MGGRDKYQAKAKTVSRVPLAACPPVRSHLKLEDTAGQDAPGTQTNKFGQILVVRFFYSNPFSASHRSASNAAMQPVPAAVMACR